MLKSVIPTFFLKLKMKIEKPLRHFIAQDLVIHAWSDLKKYFDILIERTIDSKEEFEQWLKDKSELEAVIEEDMAWRYIKMTINTKDESLTESYTFFVTEIQPQIAPMEDLLNRKLNDSPFLAHFMEDEAYAIYFRSVKSALKLFREENVALEAEINELSQQYGAIAAAQSIEHEGKTLTMQKAASLLRETNEALRKEIYVKIATRRAEDKEKLDDLYTQLIQKRHQLALNAGFENFRDYMFEAMGRFDYTKEDCFDFHQAIQSEIVPLVKLLQADRLKKLGKDKFKPWDTEVDPEGKAPLKPFKDGQELLNGTVDCFAKIDPYFADCIQTMAEMGHLDLESKDGKAPGGYNYPLYEIGVPFIFMNAVGTQNDLTTMVHEGGHAVHSFLSRDLTLTAFKNLPSEVAELASMSMELLSMNEWNSFYNNEEDLKRAKKDQLESVLKVLPWIAMIDQFQHWIYTHPNHSVEERHQEWLKIAKQYSTGLMDWDEYEAMQSITWQKQLHLYEVPFYYIEYGIAQLGALGVWKNSLTNYGKAIDDYKAALTLGYSKSIPKIYETAGVKFDFSKAYLKDLAAFIQVELMKI